jgi:hypothetical protein
MTKMTKIVQRRRAAARRVTAAAAKPEHMLNETQLDQVAAGGGMAGGVVGTNA